MGVVINKKNKTTNFSEYRLSIQSTLDGFSFSMFNKTLNRIDLKYKSDYTPVKMPEIEYYKSIKNTVDEFSLLKKEFSEVHLTVNSNKYVLVPLSVFDKRKLKKYILGEFVLDETEELNYQILDDQLGVIIFAVDSTLAGIFSIFHNNLKIFPIIYNPIRNLPTAIEYNKVFVYFDKFNCSIIGFIGSKMIYCNSFEAFDINTVLYFTQLALKVSLINPEFTKLFYQGSFNSKDLKIMSKYFPLIEDYENNWR